MTSLTVASTEDNVQVDGFTPFSGFIQAPNSAEV